MIDQQFHLILSSRVWIDNIYFIHTSFIGIHRLYQMNTWRIHVNLIELNHLKTLAIDNFGKMLDIVNYSFTKPFIDSYATFHAIARINRQKVWSNRLVSLRTQKMSFLPTAWQRCDIFTVKAVKICSGSHFQHKIENVRRIFVDWSKKYTKENEFRELSKIWFLEMFGGLDPIFVVKNQLSNSDGKFELFNFTSFEY